MRKFIFFVVSILIVPIFCFFASRLLPNANYSNLFMLILYFLLSLWCVFYLRRRKVGRGDFLLAFGIGLVTMTYTIPLSYIGIAAGLSTACVFMACRDILPKQNSSFVWIRAGALPNVKILGSISLLYSVIVFTQYNESFVLSPLSPLLAIKACAPAISEELIFRVFLPVMLYKIFKLEDSTGNNVWVFVVITVPFALLHCTELIVANDVSQVIRRSYTSIVNSLIHAFLISRYGFLYGVYAHALSDFIAMSLV